ncbi:Protein of unknown function DUF2346 [Phaffia rhodozyma]|uniref:Uncharacterized protein n=1 Tax=Phaffia rhodozyma TaxID=264483 RepID=A0A0F7SSQ4_PHARH|nr:Protein of unknown function DUF2346 [Phaffia rhodozyma]
MGGANLEVFKFGFYLFFPIAVMTHFGDPQWYEEHVAPYRQAFWPDPAHLSNIPNTKEGMESELSRLKAQRAAVRQKAAERAQQVLNGTAVPVPPEEERELTPREIRFSGAFKAGLISGYGPKEKWV